MSRKQDLLLAHLDAGIARIDRKSKERKDANSAALRIALEEAVTICTVHHTTKANMKVPMETIDAWKAILRVKP